MTKITAIIPTFNEEANIQNALDAVRFADEIIVIDSFSTDATLAIVKKNNAVLLQRKFDNFSSQKNFAISKASHNWIFLLDADESIGKKLEEEILKTVNSNDLDYAAFYIYRNFFFKDKRLYFSGWRRDKVIRLFRKDTSEYKGKVHEEIYTKKKIGFLSEKIQHYSYRSHHQYKNKLKVYSKLQAEELLEKGILVTPYHLMLKPLVRFLIQYFIKFGFLDGKEGFIISRLHAYGVWRRYVEVLQLKKRVRNVPNPIARFNSDVHEKEVSILIVNYKSWTHLSNCLDALQNITEENFTFEVVVVDNKSDDGKLQEFSDQYGEFRFIENSGNNGFANGCNTAALASKGAYLLFLNPDTVASEQAIAAMLAHLKQDSTTGIASCNQLNANGGSEDMDRMFLNTFTLFGLSRALYRIFKKKTVAENNVLFPEWVSGSVVFMSRAWFQRVAGWNEDFWMYFEDVDISKKVQDAGGKVALLKDTNIIHNHGGASRINMKTASITKTEVLISKHVYLATHFKGLKRFLLLFAVVVNTFFSKLLFAIMGVFFFFIPKLKLNIYLFLELLRYYIQAIKKGSWLSKRGMNFPFKKQL